MNAQVRQYLFGAIFIGVAIYNLYRSDLLEFSLYCTAGLAFIVNAFTFEPRFLRFKRPLVILTWVLIASAALLFFYVLQFKF